MGSTIKRKEYFLNQGYSPALINLLESCGVSKHMLWFLNGLKHVHDVNTLGPNFASDIKLINEHIEKKSKNNFKSLDEALKSAHAESYRKNMSLKKVVHTFVDGHSITILEEGDLHSEGMNMSNCVGGYGSRISSKERAIFALKSPEGETLVHFELMKNGLISQNFERANMPVRHKYWKYIYEFLKQNSKNIPSLKHFGFSWKSHTHTDGNGILISAECLMPKRISKYIGRSGQIETSLESYDVLKKFDVRIPKTNLVEFDKDVFIKKLKATKAQMVKSMDDIISSVEMTDGENLYVSDKIKEMAFGEGNYLMKGDGYTALDMGMFSSGNDMFEEAMPAVDEARVGQEPRNIEAQGEAPIREERIRMAHAEVERDFENRMAEEAPRQMVEEVRQERRRPHLMIRDEELAPNNGGWVNDAPREVREEPRAVDVFEPLNADGDYMIGEVENRAEQAVEENHRPLGDVFR